MENQVQNPDFMNNPEEFYSCMRMSKNFTYTQDDDLKQDKIFSTQGLLMNRIVFLYRTERSREQLGKRSLHRGR